MDAGKLGGVGEPLSMVTSREGADAAFTLDRGQLEDSIQAAAASDGQPVPREAVGYASR